jgi:hypothetical protein
MKNTWFDLTEFIIFIVRIILICESCYSRFFDIGHSMLFLFEMFSSNVVADKKIKPGIFHMKCTFVYSLLDNLLT